jgi:acetyl esterase/lipase
MSMLMNRRRFLELTYAAVPLGLFTHHALAHGTAEKKTYTYKTVDKLEIQADVYSSKADRLRPALIWIHGGALIMGDRRGIDSTFRDQLAAAGFAVVSIDYRLAPETKLAAILEDVQDACKWAREKGPELFQADPRRIAVAGNSAGGYLALTTGYRVEPKPRALVAFWGFSDITGDWVSKPNDYYRRQPLVTREEARQAVGTMPLATPAAENSRGRFFLYCRQQGVWPQEVAGLDSAKDASALYPFCPIRNVTAQYPPTLLVHGTKDMDVPYEQSSDMARELTKHRVDHELIRVRGAGHGLADAKPEEAAEALASAVAFVKKHVG